MVRKLSGHSARRPPATFYFAVAYLIPASLTKVFWTRCSFGFPQKDNVQTLYWFDGRHLDRTPPATSNFTSKIDAKPVDNWVM